MEKEELEKYRNKKVSILLDSAKYCIKGKVLNISDNFMDIHDAYRYETRIDLKHIAAISEEE